MSGLQIVGTRCAAVTVKRLGNTSGRTDIQEDVRAKTFMGSSAVTGIRLAFSGTLVGAGAVESAFGNTYTAQAAIETITPSAYENFLFSGSEFGAVTSGSSLISSAVSTTVIAGQQLFIRLGYSIASNTLGLPSHVNGWTAGGGDFQAFSPAVVSQVDATGVMSNPAGGSTAIVGAVPYALLGIATTPMVSVGILGDSIADGQGDQLTFSSSGAVGFVQRGLDGVNGYSVPWISWSVPSNRLQFDTTANGPSKRTFFPYITHLICELGTNDIGNGRTLVQMQADLTDICNGAKAITGPYGTRTQVAVCTIGPRTSSTDSWATTANQTPVSGYELGGICDQYNSWLVTQEGILFDKLIDTRSICRDPVLTDRWAVTGAANYATNDGLHPRGAMHALMAVAVNTVVKTFTAKGYSAFQINAFQNNAFQIIQSPNSNPPVITITTTTGSGDDAWKRYLLWLKQKKRKQFKLEAKKVNIPTKEANKLAKIIIEQVEQKEIMFTPPAEQLARQAAEISINQMYEAIWQEKVNEALIKLRDEEEEFFMVMM